MDKINELVQISEEQIRAVRRAYNKTEEEIQEDVNLLLEWLKKQPHLPKCIEGARLERFLLGNKFRVEQTKIKLDNYYSFKNFYPQFYTNMDPESQLVRNVRKSAIVTSMPQLLPTLSRIIYVEFVKNEEENLTLMTLLQYILIIWEFHLTHDYAASIVFICNAKHMNFKHITKLDPPTIHRWFLILKNGYSGRTFQIHYVNMASSLGMWMNMLKKSLSSKIFEKMIVHPDCNSLHKIIPKEYLPKEIEGSAGSAEEFSDKWYQQMILQRDFIRANVRESSNEKLRIEKSIYSDMFGADGTFRNINID